MPETPRAVVLLSGGLDSATTLAEAGSAGFELNALTVRYGQRHAVEIEAARRVARALAVARHVELEIDLRALRRQRTHVGAGRSQGPRGRGHDRDRRDPVTYVPARNTVFLSLALAWAETLGAFDIFIGVNCVDYSGYPDCRPEYLRVLRGSRQPGHARGCRRAGPIPDPRAALDPQQGADHRARPGAGRGLRADPQLLRPGRRGASPADDATRAGSAGPPSTGWGSRTRSRYATPCLTQALIFSPVDPLVRRVVQRRSPSR